MASSFDGSLSVLVRGFDFGTSEDQIIGHMSSAGAIQSVQWVNNGSVRVTYSSAEEAMAAAAHLQQTNIPGNKRYLDVLSMDPQEFLAGLNIDMETAQQFYCDLTPEQQQAVIAKGSLSTARDPAAVLVQRMKQVKGGVSATASFNSAGGMGGSSSGGSRSVLVRGFDFGTSEEEIVAHMSAVGTIESVQKIDSGSARVNYSSAEEAKAAAVQMQQTNIPGNKRYLDVLILDPQEFLAGHDIDMERTQQFYALTPEQQQSVMARGSLSTARDPTAVLVQRMKQATFDASAHSFNSAGGMGGSVGGCVSVLVRGFDFGTSEEQIVTHMSSVGTITSVQWITDGSVTVNYSSAQEAKLAVAHLNQTNVAFNKRYLDVISMDPQAFLAGHNIDNEKTYQFYSLTPEQQQVVIAGGSLSTARDPTAVLVKRMQQAKGGGKGSYGPAKGGGGGMSGDMGNGPYGVGGSGMSGDVGNGPYGVGGSGMSGDMGNSPYGGGGMGTGDQENMAKMFELMKGMMNQNGGGGMGQGAPANMAQMFELMKGMMNQMGMGGGN